jgi:autotransporter strand-loop-strand O-heptosyltransferase
LRESIAQVKALGYPLLLTSHYPLPEDVVKLVDFHIYDKRDIMSGDDRPVYWRTLPDGTKETTMANIPCHAVASTMNVRNGFDFCLGKYDWIYHMSSDCEVDLVEWVRRVQASTKPLIGVRWDHQENTFGGQMVAGRTDVMDKWLGRYGTWEEFAAEFGDQRFNSEEGMFRRAIAAAGDEGFDILDMELGNRFDQIDREAWKDDVFQFHFIDGPFLNIVGMSKREYDVNFIDLENVSNNYSLKQTSGMWSRPQAKYAINWIITASLNGEEKFRHVFDLKGKNVMISLGSKALGDTMAWVPYVEEFRKKHDCNIFLSTWWNNILDYPEINMIKPGDVVENIYATYDVGCFDNQQDKNPVNWRTIPLQKVAADILGLEYKPLRARLKYEPAPKKGNGNLPKPYICFSEFSTMKNKLWNREGGWQEVIDHLVALGYDCVSISAEQSQLTGIVDHCGQSIEQTLTDISGCEFYIGLNHGPIWIAYSLEKPVILIDGVAEEWNNPPNPYRIAVDVGCKPCFNDPAVPISRDWEWCHSGRDYACTKAITEIMVIDMIKKLRMECFSVSPVRGKKNKEKQHREVLNSHDGA